MTTIEGTDRCGACGAEWPFSGCPAGCGLPIELEDYRKDAERYRWLRRHYAQVTSNYPSTLVKIDFLPQLKDWQEMDGRTFDLAIDGAIKAFIDGVSPK